MLLIQNPRTVTKPGTKEAVQIADQSTLRDALRDEGILFLPSWLRVNLGWEGKAVAEVTAAFVKGSHYCPGRWQLCAEPLSLGTNVNNSRSLFRCNDKEIDPDFDSGFTSYVWGLPKEAAGLVFALTLDEGQQTKSLAEIGSIQIQVDADDNADRPEGTTPNFVPVMSLACDVTTINASTAVIAGLFVGSELRYGIKDDSTGFCYHRLAPIGQGERQPPRQDRLQLLPLSYPKPKKKNSRPPFSISTGYEQGRQIIERLGLMAT